MNQRAGLAAKIQIGAVALAIALSVSGAAKAAVTTLYEATGVVPASDSGHWGGIPYVITDPGKYRLIITFDRPAEAFVVFIRAYNEPYLNEAGEPASFRYGSL